jgi:AcrR family transcriptional regulator
MGRKGWTGSPSADDREARKRIVDAAIVSIDRRGPQRTTLSDVANDLGVTRPTVYRHFSSTEDLLAVAAEAALDGWRNFADASRRT